LLRFHVSLLLNLLLMIFPDALSEVLPRIFLNGS
jgi:hypothetical protein